MRAGGGGALRPRDWSGAVCGVRVARRSQTGVGGVGCLVEAEAEQAALDPVVVDVLCVHHVLRAHERDGVVSQAYAAQTGSGHTGSGCAVGATGAERVAVRSVCGACAVHVRCGACVQLLRLGAMLVLPLPES